MASTYSPLKVELIGTGEQAGTWGTTTNTNLGTALEEAITGRATATFPSDANYTLPYTNTNSTQVFRNLVLDVRSSGNLGATRDLIIPAIEKQYFVENNTSGGQSIRVKTAAGTGVTIPNGKIANVFCDGTNTRFADDFVAITGGTISGVTLSLGAALGVTSGGTGLQTATQGDILYASASNTYVALPKNTTATRYLSNTGTSNNPAWAQIDLSNGTTGELPVNRGGTGAATLTANNLVVGNGTSAVNFIAPGTNGQVLISNGTTWAAGNVPASVSSFSAGTTGLTPNTATTGAVTLAGTLGLANGGTGGTTAATARLNLQVPSTSGGGASGTWAINISGNAATATTLTTNQVLAATAGASVGAVGTYAFLALRTSSTFTAGDTYAGSNLVYAGLLSAGIYSDNTAGAQSTTYVTGTWRAMGSANNATRVPMTLFLRIS
jgi:hypothetical protein